VSKERELWNSLLNRKTVKYRNGGSWYVWLWNWK